MEGRGDAIGRWILALIALESHIVTEERNISPASFGSFPMVEGTQNGPELQAGNP